ncbi:MAG: hypothetical protein IT573_11085 [Deltaproteobacteria bacterium]|nr:hypothetical protein [Deltaproteobacteria bacterium]
MSGGIKRSSAFSGSHFEAGREAPFGRGREGRATAWHPSTKSVSAMSEIRAAEDRARRFGALAETAPPERTWRRFFSGLLARWRQARPAPFLLMGFSALFSRVPESDSRLLNVHPELYELGHYLERVAAGQGSPDSAICRRLAELLREIFPGERSEGIQRLLTADVVINQAHGLRQLYLLLLLEPKSPRIRALAEAKWNPSDPESPTLLQHLSRTQADSVGIFPPNREEWWHRNKYVHDALAVLDLGALGAAAAKGHREALEALLEFPLLQGEFPASWRNFHPRYGEQGTESQQAVVHGIMDQVLHVAREGIPSVRWFLWTHLFSTLGTLSRAGTEIQEARDFHHLRLLWRLVDTEGFLDYFFQYSRWVKGLILFRIENYLQNHPHWLERFAESSISAKIELFLFSTPEYSALVNLEEMAAAAPEKFPEWHARRLMEFAHTLTGREPAEVQERIQHARRALRILARHREDIRTRMNQVAGTWWAAPRIQRWLPSATGLFQGVPQPDFPTSSAAIPPRRPSIDPEPTRIFEDARGQESAVEPNSPPALELRTHPAPISTPNPVPTNYPTEVARVPPQETSHPNRVSISLLAEPNPGEIGLREQDHLIIQVGGGGRLPKNFTVAANLGMELLLSTDVAGAGPRLRLIYQNGLLRVLEASEGVTQHAPGGVLPLSAKQWIETGTGIWIGEYFVRVIHPERMIELD